LCLKSRNKGYDSGKKSLKIPKGIRKSKKDRQHNEQKDKRRSTKYYVDTGYILSTEVSAGCERWIKFTSHHWRGVHDCFVLEDYYTILLVYKIQHETL
jgi:hypothetical protein